MAPSGRRPAPLCVGACSGLRRAGPTDQAPTALTGAATLLFSDGEPPALNGSTMGGERPAGQLPRSRKKFVIIALIGAMVGPIWGPLPARVAKNLLYFS